MRGDCVQEDRVAAPMMHVLRRASNNTMGWAAPFLPGFRFSSSQPHPNPSTTAESEADNPPRPYKDLPGPRGLPFIGTALDYVNQNKLSRVVQQRVDKYGMTYKEKMFPGLPKQVVTCNPKDVETVLRADGPWPYRPTGGVVFRKLRKATDMQTGVLFS